MALSAAFTDLAAKIQQDYAAGQATRSSLGTKGVAFGWASGLPNSIADFVSTMQIEGRSVPVGQIVPSGTPVAAVDPGAPKSNAVAVTVPSVDLIKYAGYGSAQVEQAMDAQGLIGAIASVLGAGAVLAFEAAAMTAVGTATSQTQDATTWHEGILAAQGVVVGNGGSPGLLVVSPEDYGSVVTDLAASPGFALDPRSPVGQYFGSAVHVSPGLTAGSAYVMDPAAFVAIESETGPLVLVDPFSQATSNIINIVVDLFAALGSVNPALSVEVTKTP